MIPNFRESSICGAVSGGISAGLTTPLDVAKTRIMLAGAGSVEARSGTLEIWRIVIRESGVKGNTGYITSCHGSKVKQIICICIIHITHYIVVRRS